MNKKSFSHFGYSTILLAFAMICIVTFSALAFVTANSDYKLSKKVAQRTTTYYEAQEQASLVITTLDDKLLEIYNSCATEEEFLGLAESYLSTTGNSYERTGNVLHYHMTETLSSTQTLEISLDISYPLDSNDTFYDITEWKTVTNTFFEEDDTLNLIGGN